MLFFSLKGGNMTMIKKWAKCVVSFVAGVLGLALSACPGMIVKGSVDGSALGTMGEMFNGSSTEKVKAFKVITDGSLYTDAKAMGIGKEFLCLKVFAIITLVVAVLLIVYSIIALLQNLNVLKSHIAFDVFGWSMFALFVIATIGLLIASNSYANAFEEKYIGVLKLEISTALTLSGLDPITIIAAIKFNVEASVGLYQPFMLTVGIISALAVAVFDVLRLKKSN